MHALHCILVDLADLGSPEELTVEDIRNYAMAATEDFYEDVFDSRSEDDAGGWAGSFGVEKDVVWGFKNRELFLELLEKYRMAPLNSAINLLSWASHTNIGWYTKEQIQKESLSIMDNPQNGQYHNEHGEPLYFAGKPVRFELSEQFLRYVWEGRSNVDGLQVLNAIGVLKILNGEYTFDSKFYSVPDHGVRISKETLENARNHPEDHALVFSDYHF